MGCFWGKRNKADLASTVYRTVDHFNHITMLVSTSILLARAADRGQSAVKEEALARAKVAEKWIEIGSVKPASQFLIFNNNCSSGIGMS